jgi:galactokinase
MPAAIGRHCLVAACRNGTRRLDIVSANLGAEVHADLDALTPRRDWSDYVAGVAASLLEAGISLEGCDLWIDSNVPLGAGVSSSAALEVAVACALTAIAEASPRATEIAPMEVALLAQKAENAFVGMPCGIMDQFASAHGVAGHALLLDCRALAWRAVPLPAGVCFLVIDSMHRHAHAGGDYRRRREECEAAASLLGVAQLRDVRERDLGDALCRLPDGLARRCRHVVSENARVLSAVRCLERGDGAGLGRAMNASHASLRDDMEVSSDALDTLAAMARDTHGVLGARMMGGGFGGSVIVAVEEAAAEAARRDIAARYAAHVGRVPDAFLCRAVAGAGEIVA